MSTLLVSFLLALGACIWLYPRIINRTGYDNNSRAWTTLLATGLTIFILLALFLNLFF